MPDDIRIPDVGPNLRERAPLSRDTLLGGGYRARRAGSEPGLDLVKAAAAGLGGLLLLCAIGYSVLGRHPTAVPVIEADSRPIRVKPDNPGGMQIAGADELTLSDDRTSHDRMAPAAEVPAPQALRAQMQPPAPTSPAPTSLAPITPPPAAAPAVPATPGATPSTPSAGTVGASPLPDTPSQSATTTAAPPLPARPAAKETLRETAKPTNAGTIVQLGALSSEALARTEWQRLTRILPGMLDGREPMVTKVERDGRTYWRLRTGGFSDIADATEFCGKLRAKGGSCTIASF